MPLTSFFLLSSSFIVAAHLERVLFFVIFPFYPRALLGVLVKPLFNRMWGLRLTCNLAIKSNRTFLPIYARHIFAKTRKCMCLDLVYSFTIHLSRLLLYYSHSMLA